jgi:hypothetical protein
MGTFKKRPWFFVGSTVLILLASALSEGFSSGIDAVMTGSTEEPSILGTVVSLGLGTLISMGATASRTTIRKPSSFPRCGIHGRFGNISAPISFLCWRSALALFC